MFITKKNAIWFMEEIVKGTKRSFCILFFISGISNIQMVKYLENMRDKKIFRKYCTQAGLEINILSGEQQHNVNPLAFYLYLVTRWLRVDRALGVGIESIKILDMFVVPSLLSTFNVAFCIPQLMILKLKQDIAIFGTICHPNSNSFYE